MSLAHSLRAVADRFGDAGDDYDDLDHDAALAGSVEPEGAMRPFAVVRRIHVQFSLFAPRDFDAAREIADRLRAGGPVIVDLRDCGPELSKRLIDFCSGLAYALDGRLQDVGETVVLLVPHDVELSSNAPGIVRERRFHNQV